MAKALALLVGFGLVSVGLWAWFRHRLMDRWRERRARAAAEGASAGGDGGEVGAPSTAQGDDGVGSGASAAR